MVGQNHQVVNSVVDVALVIYFAAIAPTDAINIGQNTGTVGVTAIRIRVVTRNGK